jgi:hypothetical protein
MNRPLAMLDLFSGTGSASRAAAVRGWRVFRIDNAEDAAADVHADVTGWHPPPGPWDLVWASPPCTLFSAANASGRDPAAGMELVREALRVIREASPRWWVVENVHGATRAIGRLLGPPVQVHGSVYLWGVFPPFEAVVERDKTRKSGRQRARRRAATPWTISEGLAMACEGLARDLVTPAGARSSPELAPTRSQPGAEAAPSGPPSSPELAPTWLPAGAEVTPDGTPSSPGGAA